MVVSGIYNYFKKYYVHIKHDKCVYRIRIIKN